MFDVILVGNVDGFQPYKGWFIKQLKQAINQSITKQARKADFTADLIIMQELPKAQPYYSSHKYEWVITGNAYIWSHTSKLIS